MAILTAQQHLDHGLAFHHAGQLEDAYTSYSDILASYPNHAQTLHLMGMICISKEQYPQAIAFIVRALQKSPQLAATHFNLGVAYKETGRLDEAITSFRNALLLSPEDADTHYSLANALQGNHNSPEAIRSYRQAIIITPEHADAQNNLGIALESVSLPEEAIAAYRASLAIQFDHPQANNNLAGALQDKGEMAEARSTYRQAIASAPEFAEAHWGLAMCVLPAVFATNQEVDQSRVEFSIALTALNDWLTTERAGKSLIVGAKQPFYLAYQHENNVDLLSIYGDICVRLMQRWGKPILDKVAGDDQRLKVGIVSAHVHDHSVWNALVRAWLEHLDPERFNLQVFHLGQQHDAETEYAKSRSHYFGDLQSLQSWVTTIRDQQPDVLLYPEIGMDAMTLQLACLRLAPMQIAAWGHPETSGLSTMDYYFSAEGFENKQAQAHYRETLISLPHLGCCYSALPVESSEPDIPALGIDEGVPILLCPGSPFKYTPEHDQVFIEIAHQLGRCQFLFFTHSIPNLSILLQRRLNEVFARAGLDMKDYCRFIPFQKRSAFYGLMQRADVFMDTIGFSGFNTAMQAMECGLPIVTQEGLFMRGNLASGILDELVATTDQTYVQIVVRLAKDADYRKQVSQRIKTNRHILFDDLSPIRAMEEFMLAHARC